MSHLEKQRIKVLLGSTGSGKTHYFRKLLNSETRCFCFDPVADHGLQDWGVTVPTVDDAIVLATKSDKFRIRMQFDELERFDYICYAAMQIGNTTIAVDELSMFCSPYFAPQNFKDVIRLGRHKDVRFIATTQRPPDIHPLVLSQAKEWYIFQMHLPRDIDYLRKFVPNIEKAQTLKVGEYILWNPSQR